MYAGLRAATEHADYQIAVDAEQRYVVRRRHPVDRAHGVDGDRRARRRAAAEAGLPARVRGAGRPPPVMPALGERAGAAVPANRTWSTPIPRTGRSSATASASRAASSRDALAAAVPARTLDGLRRRTRATNGRCQGFYCGASVRALVATPG